MLLNAREYLIKKMIDNGATTEEIDKALTILSEFVNKEDLE